MLPLFIFIAIGFVSDRLLSIKDYSILSKLLLYVFTPIIAFNATVTVELDLVLLVLPIIFFLFTTVLAISSRLVMPRLTTWNSNLYKVFSYSAGSGNVAFYGIPASLILFEEAGLPIILAAMVGYIVFDSTVGFLLVGGQGVEIKTILKKLLLFPPFVAVIMGLILLPFKIPYSNIEGYGLIVENSQVTMATLGIFLIGLAVSNLKVKMNTVYVLGIAVQKILISPLLLLVIVLVDGITFSFLINYSEIMMLIATVPVATNSVILASTYTDQEGQAALGVMVTAILSLFSIPTWQYIVTTVI